MRVLVGCEESGVVRDAFRALGHAAWSCDLVPARNGGPHLQMDVKQAIRDYDWDVIILHPDCTALSLSGNRHYGAGMPNNSRRVAAIEWTVDLWNLACAKARVGVALENPLSVVFQHLQGADLQFVQPWQYGHAEMKKTGLALHRLPRLVETGDVREQMMALPRRQRERSHYMGPSPTRKRDRSTTYTGIADAFASQWGIHNMSAHAACSPSSASMWLACPASVTLTRDVVRPSSKYAREGTAAHKVAELTLGGDIFLPDKVTVEGDEVIVSPGMCRALNPYVSYVEGLRARWGSDVYLEKRLAVPGTDGMVWGTLDCGVYNTLSCELFVADLKFGKGHLVDPDTPQLKLYALALADHVGEYTAETKVTLTICQPRIGDTPLRSHVTDMGALWDWLQDTVKPAVIRIKAGDTSEVAGAHCRWCVRKTECKAFAQKHQTHASAAFDDGGLFS